MTAVQEAEAPRAPASDIKTRLGLSYAEFVGMVALMMGLTALSTDIMLVALPAISHEFALPDPNMRQFVVTGYMIGFGLGHLVSGPVSDRFGRKPVLLAGLAVYALATLLAIVSGSFAVLIVARFVQGIGASAPRVVAIAVVRDCFHGRTMARVMSFAMTLFIIVPVVAPSIGTMMLLAASWHWIFGLLLAVSIGTALWIGSRLPETNTTESDSPYRGLAGLKRALGAIVRERMSVGYTVALSFVYAALMIYISTAQQLYADIFGVVALFPLAFASVAITLAIASIMNATLVERLGTRKLSHGALLGFVGVSCLAALLMAFGVKPPLVGTIAFLMVAFYCIGHILSNFNAIAMEPLGRMAGTGSAAIGFFMTAAGVAMGGLIGQLYDGTLWPMALGFAGLGVAALVTVLVAEGGQLFQPRFGA